VRALLSLLPNIDRSDCLGRLSIVSSAFSSVRQNAQEHTTLTRRDINKHTWTSYGVTYNQIMS